MCYWGHNLKKWCRDFRNFIFFRFYGRKTSKKWWPYWIFEDFGPSNLKKIKFSKSLHRFCRLSPKDHLYEVLALSNEWFSQEGTQRRFFLLRFIVRPPTVITGESRFSKFHNSGYEQYFLMQFFLLVDLNEFYKIGSVWYLTL